MFLFYILSLQDFQLADTVGIRINEITNPNGTVLTFTIPDFEQEDTLLVELPLPTLKGGVIQSQFTRLYITGAGITKSVGHPNLPVIRKLIEVPQEAELSIETVFLEEDEIELLHPVYPRQPPIPKIPGYKPQFTIDEQYYAQNEFLPESRATITPAGEIRGHRVALIEIYPVQYNPVKNIVKFANKIKVTINFTNANWPATGLRIERYRSPIYEARLKDIILNYNGFASSLINIMTKDLGLPIGYLIIVPDSWSPTITPLAEWKAQKGYFVTIATLSEVGGKDTATVKSYIKNAYNNWTFPPAFVLLVGDVDSIGYFTGIGQDNPPTDLYYSTMSTEDYFPDIDIARFSIQNTTQLSGLVDKTIRYEKNQWDYGTDWCKKMYFIASNDLYEIAEGTHRYCMELASSKHIICDSLWLYSGIGTPLTVALNDGRSWVMYSGHGSKTGWADCAFYVSHVHSLTNIDKPAFVGTFACYSGDYTINECFSESWLRVDRRGAIAHFASSVVSYWEEDDILQRRMFDVVFDSGIIGNPVGTWVTGHLNKAKLLFYEHFGESSLTQGYFEMYNMLGDGSIAPYWDIPQVITVEYPKMIPVGRSAIEIVVLIENPVGESGLPVKSALVSVVGDDSTFVGLTNIEGIAKIDMFNTVPCTLLITVTGHNLKPFVDICIVQDVPVYIAYRSHVISDDSSGLSAGNGNGIIDAGETIEMGIWIANYGDSTAKTVTGEILTSDTFIAIIDNKLSFGNIAGGDSAFSHSPFVFTVSQYTPDGHLVTFDLVCKDTFDSTWISQIVISIKHYIGLTLVSPNGGETLAGGTNKQIRWEKEGLGFDGYRLLFAESPNAFADTFQTSISSPQPYPHDYDSTWIIAHEGARKLKFHFSNFNTEFGYDFVYIYDKADNQIAKYSGNIGAFWSVEVPDDTVKIRLVSDSSINYYGFDIDKYVAFFQGTGYSDTIAQNINPDSTTWTWLVPAKNCTTAKVKVQILDVLGAVLVESESNNFFTILDTIPAEDTLAAPDKFILFPPYPNPVLSRNYGNIIIKYGIPKQADIYLQLYDISGRKVKDIYSGTQKKGYYTIRLEASNKSTKLPGCGIYFIRFSAGCKSCRDKYTKTKKLVIL